MIRAAFEGSDAYNNWDKSGQNDLDNFYPDFCSNNPQHVLMHYLTKDMPKGSVYGDLPTTAMVDTGATFVPPMVDVTSETTTSPQRTPRRRGHRRPHRQRRSHQRNDRSPMPSSESEQMSSQSGMSQFNINTAMGSFNTACQNLLTRIRASQTYQQPHSRVFGESSDALRLVKLKKEIKTELHSLQTDPDADEDDISLLLK